MGVAILIVIAAFVVAGVRFLFSRRRGTASNPMVMSSTVPDFGSPFRLPVKMPRGGKGF